MIENEKREFGGLLEAMKKFKLKNGLIITMDEEKSAKSENKTIIVLPVWKWLLT